jgi:hypothetical protein
MAYFGVSHLAFGKAYLESAGLKSGHWIFLIQAVMNGGLSKKSCVPLLFGTRASCGVDPPAVSNHEENGFFHLLE